MSRYDLNRLLVAGSSPRFGDRSTTGNDTFDYAPGKPNLYMLMNLKQLLVQERGIKAGFELYKQTVTKQSDARLIARQLVSQYEFAKVHSRSFMEIIPPGEPFTILPPRVIGDGNHRPVTNVTRSFYVTCVDDALVFGRSSIIEVGNVVLADFQDSELARIDDELEFDAAIFHRDGDEISMISLDQSPEVVETAISLLGCHTDFFGDWMWDSVTRYVAASHSGYLPPVPVLIDADMNPSHRQALEMMLVPGTVIIEVPAFKAIAVRHLWIAPSMNYTPFHQKFNERFKWDYVMSSPTRALPIDDEAARRADLTLGEGHSPERVFLARKSFRHRKIVNCAEIEGIAREHGFTIVYPEDLDFIEQVRLVRKARYIVGPEGSAMFLTYFVDRGAKICIFCHQLTDGMVGYNGGAEIKNIEVTIITGPEAGGLREPSQDSHDIDYEIDPAVFRGFLAEWFKTATP